MEQINSHTFVLKAVEGVTTQTLRFHKKEKVGQELVTIQDGTTDKEIIEVMRVRFASNPVLQKKLDEIEVFLEKKVTKTTAKNTDKKNEQSKG